MGVGAVVDASVSHFSASFPGSSTPCGKVGPAAGRWGYVTYLGCLEAGPPDARIRARFVLLTEAANDVGGAEAANDATAIRPQFDDEALTVHLRQLDAGRLRIGAVGATGARRKWEAPDGASRPGLGPDPDGTGWLIRGGPSSCSRPTRE